MTTPADLLAVQRVHAEHGRDAAVVEIRRRWPMITENVIEATLARILAAVVDPPPTAPGRGGNPHHDPPGHVRRNRKHP